MTPKEFYVEIPLSGYASGSIMAESEEEAIEKFADECTSDDIDWGVDESRGKATEQS